MDKEIFQKIDAIFDEVIGLDASKREQLLDDLCQGDETVRSEVVSLLNALENVEDDLEDNLPISVAQLFDERSNDLTDKRLGAYQIKRLLGRGGMSSVYLASRTDDFEKKVAIKVVSSTTLNRQAIDNFRRERQILANLEHPNIARILDGGTTTDDEPFIVMEYVDGVSLDTFCRDNRLSIDEILKLFLKVCQAVSFAHENLIVHRDLKPSNIYVTSSGDVKLLDFGIAKLLQSDRFAIDSGHTFDGSAMTLEYASPEQINGDNITVAADIYSLGVILYQLITEKRPYDLNGRTLSEIVKLIESETPSPPSLVLNIDLSKIGPDLDAIVLKALEKSTSYRYRSINDLQKDLQNFLDGLPVSARPLNGLQRFDKYIRRHRIETAIGLLILAMTLGWLATYLWQMRREKLTSEINRHTAYAAEMILAANEYENANLNRVREIVDKYKDTAEDLRGFEWYFLDRLLNPPSKVATFLHPDEVWSSVFSPDGNRILTASNDNIIRLWDIDKKTFKQTEEQKGAWKAAYYPDGKRFAVSSSSNSNPISIVYDTETMSPLLTLKGHTRRIRALDVSPNGRYIATGSQDGNVIIWDALSGKEERRFAFSTIENGVEIYDLRFSGDSSHLAITGYETLALIETSSWNMKKISKEQFINKNIVLNPWSVQFSPLGKSLAIGLFTGEVAFIDTQTLEVIRIVKPHRANVNALDFSKDGKILATASWDRNVKFIDVQSGETVNTLAGHYSGVHDIAFSPDSKTVMTSSADFTTAIWDAESFMNFNSLNTGSNISAFDAERKSLYVHNNNSSDLSKWDLVNRKKVWSVKLAANSFSASFSDTSNLFALGEREGTISFVEADTGQLIKTLKPFDGVIYSTAFSKDGTVSFVSDENGSLKAIDIFSGILKYTIRDSTEIIKAIVTSPNGELMATAGNDKIVRIYKTFDGESVFTLTGNAKPVHRLNFSPDGKLLASAGADDTVRIWQMSDGQLIKQFSGMSGGVPAIVFSPDGKRIATASDVGIIRLWNVESGDQVMSFTASQKPIKDLSFSSDGQMLYSIDQAGNLSFWDGRH